MIKKFSSIMVMLSVLLVALAIVASAFDALI